MITTNTRNPLLALVASMIMPGLGQLYNGEATKGLLLFLGLGASTPVSAWLALHGPVRVMWIVMVFFLLITLGLYIYAIVDAYRAARRLGNTYQLREFNQPYVYIIVFIIGYFFVFSGLLNYTRHNLMQSFRIPSQSMLPTILKGDILFADMRVNCLGCKTQLKRGDLAIFVYPNNRTRLYIKRILGLPGDNIQINGTDIKVNGASINDGMVTSFAHHELDELLSDHIAIHEKGANGDYTVIWRKDDKPENVTFTVPNGQVFVLGDNRDASSDSRKFGTVPLVDIVGLAKQIWFSSSKQSGVRWWRIGTLVNVHH